MTLDISGGDLPAQQGEVVNETGASHGAAQPTIGNPFRAMWVLGYRYLVPVIPPAAVLSSKSHIRPISRGKAPGVRYPDGTWGGIADWQTREPTEADIEAWTGMGASCGLRLGRQDDGTFLHAIDADTLDRPSAEIVCAHVERVFGLVPVRVGMSPKALYLVRTRDPLPYRVLRFLEGAVEILGQAKQCVMAGIHPGTGNAYRITRQLPALADLPLHDAADIEGLLRDLRAALPEPQRIEGTSGGDRSKVNQRALVGDPDKVASAVAAIPNTYRPGGYPAWIKVAVALRAALPDDYGLGLELFEEFTERGGCAEPAESAARVFGSIEPPFSVGAPWLYEQAAALSDGKFDPAEPFFDPVAAAACAAADAPSPAEGGGTAPPKFRLLSLDEVAATALTEAARPLIEDLIGQGTMSVLYGESNVGKTFVALDMAYHVASGRPWGGLRAEQHHVVYVAAEGGNGARKRAAALVAKYGPCAAFHFILSPVNLLDPDADLGPLIEVLRTVPNLGLVTLDTLSRVLAGGDENSSTAMGALVRHLDAIRATCAAHVMVVHHTGKVHARGARGHSLLRAATDTEIEIVAGGIAVTKQRDMDKCCATTFSLETRVLGRDDRGKDVTSCTVRLSPRSGIEAVAPTAKEAEVLQALDAALSAEAEPTKGVKPTAVTAVMGDTTSAGAERVRTHLGALAAKNHVVKVGRGSWTRRDIQISAFFETIEPSDEAPKNLGVLPLTNTSRNGNPEVTDFRPSGDLYD